MHFDRFDIAAAYYHFTNLPIYRGMPYDFYKILQYQIQKATQLQSMRYRPVSFDRKLSKLSPNAKQIYMNLVKTYLGIFGR
ncbi:MAG: hypothetical protein QNJ47_27000 [Nostocaceae cyanobacterium]|nr:hypothetical protein [Nostocaceae cyanobacterium]